MWAAQYIRYALFYRLLFAVVLYSRIFEGVHTHGPSYLQEGQVQWGSVCQQPLAQKLPVLTAL